MADSAFFNPAPAGFEPFPEDIVHQSLAEAFERSVRKYADRIAIQVNGQDVTYRKLDQLTDQLAFHIVERIGEKEEPVAVLDEQGFAQIVAMLAILKAGKIYAVMDLSNPPERLAAMIADLGAALIVTSSAYSSLAASVSAGAVIVEMDKAAGWGKVLIHRPFDSQAGVYYTSGSTGQPKGVVYDHRGLLHYSITANHCYRMTLKDRQPLPYSCSFAWSAPIVFSTFLCGGTLFPVNLREISMQEFGAQAAENEFTIIQFTPSILRLFMASLEPGRRHFPSLRLIVSGGEPLQVADVKLWQSLFGLDSKLGYILASTEASYITFHTFAATDPIPPGNLPVGFVVPGKEVVIVDEQRHPVPAGETGEIAVHSLYGSSGYWNKPEMTSAVFQTDPADPAQRFFYTNDLGRFLPDGKLEHFGRRDHQVKIRGYRVELPEIEAELNKNPIIKNAVVLAQPSKYQPDEKQLVAYLVLEPGNTATSASVRQTLAAKLPDYMVPPFVIFMHAMPLSVNGKIDRQALPEIPERKELLEQDRPGDKVEERLVEIWKQVFNLEMISVVDDFFDLGGDSLLAISLFLYIERSFSRQFPSNLLLQYPTIQSLASLLRDQASENPSAVIPVQPLGNKTPLFWIPSGFGVDLYVQGLAKYLAPAQPLYLLATPTARPDQLFLIEELGKIYAREIMKFYPQGPCYLIGHSIGGTIACETARELVRLGLKVPWVGLLDTAPPNTRILTLFEAFRLFIKNIQSLGFSRSFKDLGRNVFVLLAMTMLRPQWIRTEIVHRRKIPVVDILPIRESAYVKSYFIGELYHPEPYPFDILLFRAMGVRRYSLEELTKGWERFAGSGLRYLNVPGDHVGIMEEPNISVLARKICGEVADS